MPVRKNDRDLETILAGISDEQEREVFELCDYAVNEENYFNLVDTELMKLPHLLCAAKTGSGKSFFILSFTQSLMYRAGSLARQGKAKNAFDCSFRIIDPKFDIEESTWGELSNYCMEIFSSEDLFLYGEQPSDPIVEAMSEADPFTVMGVIRRLQIVKKMIDERRRTPKSQRPKNGFQYDLTIIDEWRVCLSAARLLDAEIAKANPKEKDLCSVEAELLSLVCYIARIGRSANCFVALVSQDSNLRPNGFDTPEGEGIRNQCKVIALARNGDTQAMFNTMTNGQVFDTTPKRKATVKMAIERLCAHEELRESEYGYQQGILFYPKAGGKLFVVPDIREQTKIIDEQIKGRAALYGYQTVERDLNTGSTHQLDYFAKLAWDFVLRSDNKYAIGSMPSRFEKAEAELSVKAFGSYENVAKKKVIG